MNKQHTWKSFERKIGHQLSDYLGITFRRDLEQTRQGERGDLITDEPFQWVIECKSRAEGSFSQNWMIQAAQAAEAQKKLPAVIFQIGRKKPQVAVPTYAFDLCLGSNWPNNTSTVFTSIENFCALARELMNTPKHELTLTCNYCEGLGEVDIEICDPLGFAEPIDTTEVCPRCSGIGVHNYDL